MLDGLRGFGTQEGRPSEDGLGGVLPAFFQLGLLNFKKILLLLLGV